MELSARPLFDNPSDANLFVPREEADRIELNCREGINTLLLGERGMGKTSLLHHVAFRLREAGAPCVVVDAAAADDALALLGLVTAELGRRSALQRFTQAFDPRSTAGVGETGELMNALRALRPTDEDAERTTILLDSPPTGAAAHVLFGRLRDELWQLPYTWVVAAPTSQRGQLLTPPADVFFEDVIELGPLSPDQQQDLVRRRLSPGEYVPWRLAQPGEENPRLLVEAVREAIRSGGSPDQYLTGLAERERRVKRLGRAAAMAYAELQNSGPSSASDEDLLHRLGWSRQRAAQVFAELEREGLVTAAMRPGPAGRPRKTFEVAPMEST